MGSTLPRVLMMRARGILVPYDAPQATLDQLNPPLEWFGWEVPVAVQLGVVVALGVGLLAFPIVQFDKSE